MNSNEWTEATAAIAARAIKQYRVKGNGAVGPEDFHQSLVMKMAALPTRYPTATEKELYTLCWTTAANHFKDFWKGEQRVKRNQHKAASREGTEERASSAAIAHELEAQIRALLSDCQADVLGLLLQGHSQAEIARKVGCVPSKISKIVSSIRRAAHTICQPPARILATCRSGRASPGNPCEPGLA